MNTVAILAALLFSATPPGSLIGVEASCTYKVGGTASTSPIGTGYIGVLSPACKKRPNPVFFQRYFRKSRAANGSVLLHPEKLADGMIVRFLKRSPSGDYSVLEGLQLSDGRVLVDGKPVQRD